MAQTLTKLTKFLKEVIKTGDFSRRADVSPKSGTGQLAFFLNKLMDKLEFSIRDEKKTNNQLSHINRIAQIVNSSLDLDEVVKGVSETLQSPGFQFDRVAIFLVDADKNELELAKYYGKETTEKILDEIAKFRLPIKASVSHFCDVVIHNTYKYISPITTELVEKFTDADRHFYENNPVKSYLIAPLQAQNNVIGTIVFADTHQDFHLSEKDIESTMGYVVQISTAVNNSRLYRELKSTRAQLAETEKIAAMTHVFEKFVPKQFLNRIAHQGLENIKLGSAETDSITVLFSDIRSFTSLSENMSPQEVLNFLNSYLQRMNEPIHKNHGFVDKFIGDAVMALFDLPHRTDFEEAHYAVHAAIAMQEALKIYNKHRANCGYSPISTGIGIHSGNVVIGTLGSEDRMDSTVLGDVVNVASRLEGLTKYYNANIIVSSDTFSLLTDITSFLWRELDFVNMKGKDKPISIYEVFNTDNPEIRNLKQQIIEPYHEALMNYYAMNWDDAIKLFNECLSIYPEDVISRMFAERSLTYKENPPDSDWDGSLKLDAK